MSDSSDDSVVLLKRATIICAAAGIAVGLLFFGVVSLWPAFNSTFSYRVWRFWLLVAIGCGWGIGVLAERVAGVCGAILLIPAGACALTAALVFLVLAPLAGITLADKQAVFLLCWAAFLVAAWIRGVMEALR